MKTRLAKSTMKHDGMTETMAAATWGQELLLPMVGQSVHAGFPSPADDFIEESIDLNRVLVSNPTATFLWRVEGDCMVDAFIFPGDVIVVDRSVPATHGRIVLAVVDGEPTLKRLERRGKALYLHNENARHHPFLVRDGAEVSVWGVVTSTIRVFK